MRLILLPLLVLVIFLQACSEETPHSRSDPLQQKTSFQDARSLVPGPEGIYVIGKESIFLWRDGQKSTWSDLSSRALEVWDLAFSENWDTDQLFYVYYRSRGGPSVLAEGYDGTGGQWRRSIIRRPFLEAGSLARDGRNVLFSDGGTIIRIDPYIENGEAYSIPSENPRGKEVWASVPNGEWKISLEDGNVLLWGQVAEESLLWQGTLSELRGRRLKREDFLWKRKDCELLSGYWIKEGFVFGDCTGDLLLWDGKRMQDTETTIEGLRSFLLNEEGLWALLRSGELLLQKRDYPGSAR